MPGPIRLDALRLAIDIFSTVDSAASLVIRIAVEDGDLSDARLQMCREIARGSRDSDCFRLSVMLLDMVEVDRRLFHRVLLRRLKDERSTANG